METEGLLREYEQERRAAVRLHGDGRPIEARQRLLAAAARLYELARTGPPASRRRRLDRAQELVALARSCGLDPQTDAGRRRGHADTGETVQPEAVAWPVAVERPEFGFEDVAGMRRAKEEIRRKLLRPFDHPDLARKYGVRPGGGILLYGPPGTGKTLLARAVAGELGGAFFTVTPAEVLSKWVGEAEQNLRALFRAARASAPSVVFLDEIDAFAPARGESVTGVMARLVPQLLTEMDGFDGADEPVLFVGATNAPWALDRAITRPGRFGTLIEVPLPDLDARVRLLEIHLQGRWIDPGLDLGSLAQRLAGLSGADVRSVVERAADHAFALGVESGAARPLSEDLLECAIRETSPSVGPKELLDYHRFAGRTE